MNVPRGQHYVTKSYLCGFANGAGKKARLYIYERGKPEPYQQQPQKVAKQNYYYSFRDEKGQFDHSVEEFFGMIEASALPVISRLAREDFQPDWIERGWLAAFMAMHEMRVPWTRENLDEATAQLIKHMTRFSVSVPGHLERSLERMKADGKDVEPEMAKEIQEMVEHDEYDIKITDDRHSLALALEMIPELTKRYAHMKWTVVRSAESLPFITSDNPLVRVNPRYTGGFYDGHGVDNKNIEIRFPLDKTTALIVMQDLKRVEQFSTLLEAGNEEEAMQLRESVPVTWFMKAPPQLIEAVNIGTARYARRFVFAYAKDNQMLDMMGPASGGLRLHVG